MMLNKILSIAFCLLNIFFFQNGLQAKHEELPSFTIQEIASDEKDWKIGGKIHFEEEDGIGYLGTRTLNRFTKNVLKEIFQIDKEKCADHAKLLFMRDANGKFAIHQYEEKTSPGVGEEMHATLLYTNKRFENGHETLKDIYENLKAIDSSLPHDRAPTVKQVANTYRRIINPDWKFEISGVEFIKAGTGNLIIARLLLNGKDEIVNNRGQSITGNFLHLSLVNVHSSALINDCEDKISKVVELLNKALSGKFIKIADNNGRADLEFGITGSTPEERVRFQ